jgi:hypothetical protein
MRKILILLVVMSGCVMQGFGQYLKYSNEFLSLGVGARASAMGGAVVSSVDDATGAYWNPAALLNIQNNIQVALMHNEQFAGIVKQDYGTVAFKFDEKSAFGFSVIRVGVDDIPNTLNLFQNGQMDYSRISSFSSVDYAFIGSYARDFGIKNLKLGANVKVIRRVVGEFANAWGFGFDLGGQYQWDHFNFGAVLRDATTTFNVWSFSFSESEKQVLIQTNNKLPENSLELTAPKTILGVSRKWLFFKERFSVLPEVNADFTFDGKRNVWITGKVVSVDPKLGLELGYKNLVFLRGGAMNFQKETDIDGKRKTTFMPSLGAGIRINNLSIDYALANPGGNTSLPYSNIISLKLGINKKS